MAKRKRRGKSSGISIPMPKRPVLVLATTAALTAGAWLVRDRFKKRRAQQLAPKTLEELERIYSEYEGRGLHARLHVEEGCGLDALRTARDVVLARNDPKRPVLPKDSKEARQVAWAIFTLLEDTYVELESLEISGGADAGQETARPDRALEEHGRAEEE